MDSINTDSNKDKSDTNLSDHPPSIGLQGGKDTQNSASHTEQKPPKPDNSTTFFEKIMIAVNIFLVFLTIILAYANWNLAKDSRKQIELAEKNMVFSNAPWFKIECPKFITPAVDSCDSIFINIENVGKTPANNVKSGSHFFVYLKGTFNPKDSSIYNFPDTLINSTGTFPPNAIFKTLLSRKFEITTINNINSGEIVLMFITVVKYDDIFGHSWRYTTSSIYDPQGKNFVISNYGNEYKQIK